MPGKEKTVEKNRVPIDGAQCKERLIQMLVRFDRFCRENNLSYYLAWGTLLGAVRHHGFIPWDDDVDLAMPRKDYEKLILLCKDWDLPYNFFCYELDETYPFYFGKISDKNTVLKSLHMREIPDLGLFIDVFPVDELKGSVNVKIFRRKMKLTMKMLEMSAMKKFWSSESHLKSCVKFFLYSYAKFKKTKYWQEKIKYLLKNASDNGNENCRYSICAWEIYPVETFGGGAKLLFEGNELPAPADADKQLSIYYGDYMVLPPKEKQVSVHDYEIFQKL